MEKVTSPQASDTMAKTALGEPEVTKISSEYISPEQIPLIVWVIVFIPFGSKIPEGCIPVLMDGVARFPKFHSWVKPGVASLLVKSKKQPVSENVVELP